MEETKVTTTEKYEDMDEVLREEPNVIIHELKGSKSMNLIALMAKDNEKLIPLFFPCYIIAIGFIVLTGIN